MRVYEATVLSITTHQQPTRKAELLAYLAQMHLALGWSLYAVGSSMELCSLTAPQIRKLVRTMEDYISANTTDAEWKLDRVRGKALNNVEHWESQCLYERYYG